MTSAERGSFVISLDTELCWGTFDIPSFEKRDYIGTRNVIRDLLALFDEYETPVTWALVTHLLSDCRDSRNNHESLSECASVESTDWYSSLPCQTGMDERSWYEPSIVDWIRDATVEHDIGSHTHTHLVLEGRDRELARADIEASVSVAESVDEPVRSFVYPRNCIDYRDIVRDAGFDAIRGRDARWYESIDLPASFRKVSRFVDEATTWTPPTVVPTSRSGLVEIPGSQVFRPHHGGWQYTPSHSQQERAIAGLNRAAQSGEIFHLWFHPFNLAKDPERLLIELEDVLKHAEILRERDELRVQTMASIADDYRNGRWSEYI